MRVPKELAKRYHTYVQEAFPTPTSRDRKGKGSDRETLSHLHWMCDQLLHSAENWHSTRAHRWIGFIQGVLWAMNYVSIDDLRSHVNALEK